MWHADVTVTDEEGYTALDWAAKGHHYEPVALLLHQGVSLDST